MLVSPELLGNYKGRARMCRALWNFLRGVHVIFRVYTALKVNLLSRDREYGARYGTPDVIISSSGAVEPDSRPVFPGGKISLPNNSGIFPSVRSVRCKERRKISTLQIVSARRAPRSANGILIAR